MIGIIPSSSRTFEVFGDFNSKELTEGKLYYDNANGRVYFYSSIENRSNPRTGMFPVWDGKNKYVSKFSNEKFFPKDVITFDIGTMSSSINKDLANDILNKQRRCDNDEILVPDITDGDNMFTQCIKGSIKAKKLTMIDLVDMTSPKLEQKVVENFYSALTKITFMRADKWNIWLDCILHITYHIDVFRDEKKLVSFDYPSTFDTGIVKYDNITSGRDDPLKKIIKILMIKENINKNSLKSDEIDDYTINNMMTTLNGDKPLSAQLFSRFIRMANLSYKIVMIDKGQPIFEYKE